MDHAAIGRRCFCDPIPAVLDAARYLDAAVSAHLSGHVKAAEELFALANDPDVRAWLETIWSGDSPYINLRKLPPSPAQACVAARMPTQRQKTQLDKRDGFHCRYCGVPVIRSQIRTLAASLYPSVITWGRTNASQHAGFQALWAQYDHVVPYSGGGANDLSNLVVTCAGCNYGKAAYRLEEVGLLDPRDFPPVASSWDGLERLAVGAAPALVEAQ